MAILQAIPCTCGNAKLESVLDRGSSSIVCKSCGNLDLPNQSNWPKERVGWWAPGEYLNHCRRCGKMYVGDKRSMHCWPCTDAPPVPQPGDWD